MWISGKVKLTYKHPDFMRLLSTSYTQFVDNVMLSGKNRWQRVDYFSGARYCIKNEILVTTYCISEKHDFYRLFSAFFLLGKMGGFA